MDEGRPLFISPIKYEKYDQGPISRTNLKYEKYDQGPISRTNLSLFWGLNLIQNDSWLSFKFVREIGPNNVIVPKRLIYLRENLSF